MEDSTNIKKRLEAGGWRLEAGKKNFLFLLFLGLYIVQFCVAEENKTTKEEPSQEIKDFNLVQYTPDGKKKWELNGKEASVSEALIEIGEPKAIFYGQDSSFNISAEKGLYNKPQNDIRLRDNVVLTSSDGMEMKTDFLYWKAASQNIFTSAPVFVTKDNLRTIGTGASCNLEEKRLNFNKNVSAEMRGEATTITCDGPLELDYGKNRAIFHKNVEVKDNQGHLLSDRMDVFFDPKTKKVKRVIASGNVKIIIGENVTYSRVAIYLVDQKKVILPKRPRLVIAPGSVPGTNNEKQDGTEQPLTPNP